MAAPLDLDAINELALAQSGDVLARLVHPGGRASGELLALNRDAPRLPDLHVRIEETGRWFAASEAGVIRGAGIVQLVAYLADVDMHRAAQFVTRIVRAAT